jgi:hypothetical protein
MEKEITFQSLIIRWRMEIRYNIFNSSLTRTQCIKIWNNFISDFAPYLDDEKNKCSYSSLKTDLRLELNKAENNHKFQKRKNPLFKIPPLHFHFFSNNN